MNGTKETYQLIADTISKTLPAKRLISRLESFSNWEELVMVGSQQLLLPLLYRSLEQKGLIKNLPDDLADYLNQIHHINLNRNKAILHQLRDLHALFEKHHIDYVLIKGAAILVRLREEDLGLRMVGDIDLLIPSGQITQAQSILETHGYELGKSFSYKRKNFRHLDRLVHEQFIAALEIHTKLFNQKNHLLPAGALLKESQAICGFRVPKTEHLIKNALLSAQINDNAGLYKQIHLKSLADCLQMGLHTDTSLFRQVLKIKETRFLLGVGVFFFDDFKNMGMSGDLKKELKSIELKFRYPSLSKELYKIKRIYWETTHRIKIFAINADYRRHVLKNKIFPIFN